MKSMRPNGIDNIDGLELKPKPCPFCGCKYEKDDEDFWWIGAHEDWCPLSSNHGYYGGLLVADEPEEIERWNRRKV